MIYGGYLVGKYVKLRSVEERDAEITLALRLDKKLSRFLHKLDNDVEKQRLWICEQRNKQDDLFFVVENRDNKVIGTMGICNLEKTRGYVGRLLMSGSAIESFEAYLLLFRFVFFVLGLDEIYGDTDIENLSAMRFSKAFGYQFGDTEYDPKMNRYIQWGTLSKENFIKHSKRIESFIYR